MELANCLLALGGDRGNTVPKTNVTPAEIAVMCHIHGVDAVFDIAPSGEVDRSNSEEMLRLMALYPAKNDDGQVIVQVVYPGRSPVLHTELVDLGLPEEAFLATQRMQPEAKPVKIKPAKAKAEKPAPVSETAPAQNDITDLFEGDE